MTWLEVGSVAALVAAIGAYVWIAFVYFTLAQMPAGGGPRSATKAAKIAALWPLLLIKKWM